MNRILNTPIITIFWIFFFILSVVIWLVLTLCSESHCTCCCCLRCCRECCSDEVTTGTEGYIELRGINRTFSDSTWQNSVLLSRSNGLNAGRKTCATQTTSIFPPSHPHNQVLDSCDRISIDRSAARNNTLFDNLKPVIPLSALTNIDDQHQAMAQRCCLPQVSSTSSQGPNFIHDYQHAPICSMEHSLVCI